MLKFLPKRRINRLIFIACALVVLAGVGLAGAKWIAWPYFKTWRENRANSVAREFFKQDDYPNALVAVRKTLQYNQANVEAWKLAVEITEKQQSPQTFVYQQGLTNVQPTLENKLKLVRVAVKHRAYPQALDAINKVGMEGSNSAEFFELASHVAQVMRNPTKAKYYLMSLVKLRPDDNLARFELAQIRLLDGFADNKPSIRAEIRNLSTDPKLRVRALTILLADSVEARSEAEALEIADTLATMSDLPPAAHMMVAEAYRRSAPKRFGPYIEKLKTTYAIKPELAVVLVGYLTTHEMPKEARAWADSLGETVRKDECFQVSYAALLLDLKENAALETYLRPLKWTENEFVRQLLLAHAARVRADDRAFADAWRLAVIEVGNNPRRLQMLLTRVNALGWPEQRMELLWRKFSMDPSDKAARNQLGTWERSRQNTAGINRLYGRINEFDPSDRDSKNNYAYSSLLLGTSMDRAHADARNNYDSDPRNSYFATTYALSLLKQNKAPEALQVIESQSSTLMAVDERTLLHGVLLIANGRIDEGLELTAHLKHERLLPEERRLYESSSLAVAKARRDQEGVARLAAFTNSEGASPNRKSWLQALPSAFRTRGVQMELADSLYAADDYRALEATLKNETWEPNDFLRKALMAYAQKNLGRDSDARATWRAVVATAGHNPTNLSTLEEMCERWGWIPERIEVLNRILQGDPASANALNELVDYYSKNGQTAELARLYGLRVNAETATDPDSKSRFAYYSLLTNTNVSRAHVLAKQAYDAGPDAAFSAKTYALSLHKQARFGDAWRTIENLTAIGEKGPAQLNLLRAAISLGQGQVSQARSYLSSFDSQSALPEEAALAESLAKTLDQKNT